ncbi:MAG: hypothetical protein Q4G70_08285 [Pseudomonadota bacterium]|nr:hypothetical protein [Pseudomonadota bacterium]
MDWTYNTIWHDQLPPDYLVFADFRNSSRFNGSLKDKRYIFADRFKSCTADFVDFPPVGLVDYLYIWSSNIKSLNGISKLSGIKRLEVQYCLKLENDLGLSQLGDSLKWLHINQSKKLSPSEELFSLYNLRVLCLNECGPIHNLEFLHRLPHLLDFRFVNTKILSGDLTPLLEHPTLCSAGFVNKKHYNLKKKEVDEHFRLKRDKAIEKVYRDSYETYRYINAST